MALHAAVVPALSTLYPAMFIYDENRNTGGNTIGKSAKGRICCAVMSVASSVGGSGFSRKAISHCCFDLHSSNRMLFTSP